MGGPSFFLVEQGGGGGLKGQKEGWRGGVFFNKSKKLSFVIFWYYV